MICTHPRNRSRELVAIGDCCADVRSWCCAAVVPGCCGTIGAGPIASSLMNESCVTSVGMETAQDWCGCTCTPAVQVDRKGERKWMRN